MRDALSSDQYGFEAKLQQEVIKLRRQGHLLFAVFLLTVALFGAFLVFYHLHNKSVLVAESIVIADSQGRPRIILSGGQGEISGRKRSDDILGIVVLDSTGNDQVTVGEIPIVQVNGEVVHRAQTGPYGMAFCDEFGDERGGLGYYPDRKLAALGLDGPSGEGIVLFVPDSQLFGQKVGLIMNDPQQGGQLIYLGSNTEGVQMLNLDSGSTRFSLTNAGAARALFIDKMQQELVLFDSKQSKP